MSGITLTNSRYSTVRSKSHVAITTMYSQSMDAQLRQLTHTELLRLLAVAESGSISQAARELHIAQPALSKTIRSVEDTLQFAVFERSHRGVVVTAEGQVLLERGRAIRSELARMERDVTEMRRGEPVAAVVGIEPVHSVHLVVEALVSAIESRPEAKIRLEVGPMSDLLHRLEEGKVDFAFGALPESQHGRGLIEQPIYYEDLLVACGRASELFRAETVDLELLAQQRWVIGPAGSLSATRTSEITERLRIPPPRVGLEIDLIPTRRMTVEKSSMLSVFQRAQIADALDADTLWALPLQVGGQQRIMGTVHPQVSRSPFHAPFVHEVERLFGAAGMAMVKPTARE